MARRIAEKLFRDEPPLRPPLRIGTMHFA